MPQKNQQSAASMKGKALGTNKNKQNVSNTLKIAF
jgi:hypothetical protein